MWLTLWSGYCKEKIIQFGTASSFRSKVCGAWRRTMCVFPFSPQISSLNHSLPPQGSVSPHSSPSIDLWTGEEAWIGHWERKAMLQRHMHLFLVEREDHVWRKPVMPRTRKHSLVPTILDVWYHRVNITIKNLTLKHFKFVTWTSHSCFVF